MRFRAGELEFNATVAEASEAESARTGHIVRSLTIQFRAQKPAVHEQAMVEAHKRQTGGLFSLSERGEPELEWRVCQSSSSYIGTEPWGINHHSWRIQQVERLACERLLLGSVALEPYDYAEEADAHGVVRLAARAPITESELEALSRITAPVDVIRVGISPSPRPMTLTYVWGERPGGLGVAVRCEDVQEPRVTLQHMTADAGELDDLVRLLRSTGILKDADMEALRRGRHARRRVADVDAWRL
jgi:hypothetical protein